MTFAVTSNGLEIPAAARDTLGADDVAARLLRKDATLWGPEAEEESSKRLGWVEAVTVSRPLVPEIEALRAELDDLERGHVRPETEVTDMYDEAHAIALQMERLITDIGQYGTMIEQATAAVDEPIDSTSSTATASARCTPTIRPLGTPRAVTPTAPSCA